jgi:hypothetical protein
VPSSDGRGGAVAVRLYGCRAERCRSGESKNGIAYLALHLDLLFILLPY